MHSVNFRRHDKLVFTHFEGNCDASLKSKKSQNLHHLLEGTGK
jgi:hypothetical protein